MQIDLSKMLPIAVHWNWVI